MEDPAVAPPARSDVAVGSAEVCISENPTRSTWVRTPGPRRALERSFLPGGGGPRVGSLHSGPSGGSAVFEKAVRGEVGGGGRGGGGGGRGVV